MEITIETERTLIVRSGESRERAASWCEGCGAMARLIAVGDAATLLRAHPDAVLRWAEQAGLHISEASGAVFICLNSLSRNVGAGATMKMIWRG